jgi:AAA+ superfamily predicted ATPase
VGGDRPLLERVEWDDVVLPQAVVDDLKTLLRLLEPGEAERLSLPAPTGLILVGAPGTGKTLTARLIASQSGRSFLPRDSSRDLAWRRGRVRKAIGRGVSRGQRSTLPRFCSSMRWMRSYRMSRGQLATTTCNLWSRP